LVGQLDRNHDGRLEERERYLATPADVEMARALLLAAGASNPRIVGEMQPDAIHHGVAPARFALRSCDACHSGNSRIVETYELAERAPFGALPTLIGDCNVMAAFTLSTASNGGLSLVPNLPPLGLHVFGLGRTGWLDALGLAAVGLVLAGALGHGTLRFWSSRKRKRGTK
jgi:hypothetical protein